MKELITQEEVLITRHGYSPVNGFTTHRLYMPIINSEGKIVGKGALIGLGVLINGQELYAQLDQIQALIVSG